MQAKSTSNMRGNKTLIAVILLLIAGASWFWLGNHFSSVDPEGSVVAQTEQSENTKTPESVAEIWQWQAQPGGSGTEVDNTSTNEVLVQQAASSQRISETQVYEALKYLRLDQSGNIVLDDQTKIALDATLGQQELNLEQQELLDLRQIIEQHLPGTVGEQLGQLVVDYYQYLLAEHELIALYDGGTAVLAPTDDEQSMLDRNEALAQAADRYEELVSLRELYLGSEVVDQLFAMEDANAWYMLNSFELSADASLSEEQKRESLQQLQQEHLAESLDIENWPQRLEAYLSQKNVILQAGLSQAQQKRQIEELFQLHFNARERAGIAHLQLDSI